VFQNGLFLDGYGPIPGRRSALLPRSLLSMVVNCFTNMGWVYSECAYPG
jgi:hypothetical protein